MKTLRLESTAFALVALLAVLLSTAVPLSAQPAASEEAVEEKVAQNSQYELGSLLTGLLYTHDRVQAARDRVEAGAQNVERAWAGWYPQLDFTIEAGNEDIVRPAGSGNTNKWRNVEHLELSQLIYDFGLTGGAIDSAAAQLKEAEALLTQTEMDILYQGITAYLQCIRAWETLKYAKQSVASIKELSGMEEALVKRGAGLSYKELQIKGQLAGAMSYQVTVERALVSARNRFKSLYGFDIPEAAIAELNVPDIPYGLLPNQLDQAVEGAFKDNPTLLQAQYAVERLSADVDAAEAGFYPTLNFKADSKRRENDLGVSGVRNENRAGVEVKYNIYNGGADAAAVKGAKASLNEGKKTLLDQRRTVEEAVRNAWIDLQTLKQNAELYRAQADITWEFLQLIKKKRMTGETVELLDILVGERDYIDATSAYVTSGIDTIGSAYNILYQMGQIKLDQFHQ